MIRILCPVQFGCTGLFLSISGVCPLDGEPSSRALDDRPKPKAKAIYKEEEHAVSKDL